MRSQRHATIEPDPLAILATDEASWSLPANRRSRIIREALATSQQSRPAGLRPARRAALASGGALVVALLLVGTGYIRSTGAGKATLGGPAGSDGSAELRVYQKGDAVVLEWNNRNQETYKVRQANSASDVRQAPATEVSGHRYVDRSASDAQIVYYLVE